MKKIKIIGIVLSILLIFSIFSIITVFAVGNISSAIPKIPSYKYLPEYYDNFIYIKDFKNAEKQWKSSDIYKTMKNNFVYMDYKYKYFDTLDNYLIKFNFNTEKLISLAAGEVTAGNTGNNYFIITGMTFTAKQLLSILNILPDSPINKLNHKEVEYYRVNKSQKDLYYVKLGEHTLFGTNVSFITSAIDKYLSSQFSYKKELFDIINDNEVFVHVKFPSDFNKFEIIPSSLNTFDLIFNLSNYKTAIISSPVNPQTAKTGTLSYRESLKNIPADIPLCVYNSSKDVKTFISEILEYRVNLSGIENPEEFRNKINKADSVLNKYNNGMIFILDSLLSESSSPNLGFMLIPDKELTSNEYKKNAVDLKNTAEILLGLSEDGWTKTEKSRYTMFSNSGFVVVSGSNIAGLISDANNTFSQRVTSLMESQGASLYDLIYKKDGGNNLNNEITFLYLNNKSMASMVEPLLIKYINTLNVTDRDYENSFGAIFKYIKGKEPYIITLENKENNFGSVFYGTGEFLK